MIPHYTRSVFLYRRDLRVTDNTGLLNALSMSDEVFPVFILDPRQVDEHPYRSIHALQFMHESLEDLQTQIHAHGGTLNILQGTAEDVLRRIITNERIQAVFFNADYTPFSRTRDVALQMIAERQGVATHRSHDTLLNPPGSVLKVDGTPYTVFTPFYRVARQQPIPPPATSVPGTFSTTTLTEHRELRKFRKAKTPLWVTGGRSDALKRLNNLTTLHAYAHERDIPSVNGTTTLSAHHKFGTISIRETAHAIMEHLGFDHGLLRELYWRDFFTHIAFHYPHVFGKSFHQKYEKLQWENDTELYTTWQEGKTGFPIVDAGMRQLHHTGYMHNRVRMIVASFLTKDLLIDWRWGEQHFARTLIDYDPAVNNGNWQWAASTGCDAQPYFRIFNPWTQQRRFDPDATYIKTWVPELRSLRASTIHQLETSRPEGLTYPHPVVNHQERRERAKRLFTSRPAQT